MVESAGHEIVSSAADADVAVFNSCAVTSDAEAELRKVVRRARARTAGAAKRRDGLCGGARRTARTVAQDSRRCRRVERVVGGADLACDCRRARTSAFPTAASRTLAQTSTRALLRIQDGCDEHCTFCATTMARGANRSRSIDELVREATTLAERHSEIVITGIHIGTYGADIGSRRWARSMTRLVGALPATRFRLSSIEATEVDDALARPARSTRRGSSRRTSTRRCSPGRIACSRGWAGIGTRVRTYAAGARAIGGEHAACSDSAPTSSLGFRARPTTDHAATIALVERLPFTYLHVFPFSLRPGTAAERLPAPVAPVVAQRRAAELRAIARAKGGGLRRVASRRSGGRRGRSAAPASARGSPAITFRFAWPTRRYPAALALPHV